LLNTTVPYPIAEFNCVPRTRTIPAPGETVSLMAGLSAWVIWGSVKDSGFCKRGKEGSKCKAMPGSGALARVTKIFAIYQIVSRP
jgi:hypothetical protein